MQTTVALRTLFVGLYFAAAAASGAAAQFSIGTGTGGRDDGPPVNATLIADRTALVPGETVDLGLHFEIAEDWYLYWKNPGDTGMSPTFTLELPEGVVALDTQWPAPERHTLPGDILDYVYRNAVTLVVPVRIASDAPTGADVTIRARVSWLMCRDEVCVPGGADVTLKIPVAASAEASPHNAKFERARARTPRHPQEGEVEWRWEGRTLALRVPGAASLTYYPGPSEHAHPRDMIGSGVSKTDALRVEYDQRIDRASEVGAVIEARRADGRREFIEIVIPGPSPG